MELRADFESYIREPGRASQGLKPKPRLALRERDRQFFSDYVQGLRFDDLVSLDPAQVDNESQRNIRRNAEIFMQRINTNFANDTPRFVSFWLVPGTALFSGGCVHTEPAVCFSGFSLS